LSYTSADCPRRREKILTGEQGFIKCSPGFVLGSSQEQGVRGFGGAAAGEAASEVAEMAITGQNAGRIRRKCPVISARRFGILSEFLRIREFQLRDAPRFGAVFPKFGLRFAGPAPW